MAFEEGVINKAFREERERSERVQEKMDRWNDGIRESERQQEKFEQNYNRNNSDVKYRYNTTTGKSSWEYPNGIVIEDE